MPEQPPTPPISPKAIAGVLLKTESRIPIMAEEERGTSESPGEKPIAEVRT